jgi:hypothetical protein
MSALHPPAARMYVPPDARPIATARRPRTLGPLLAIIGLGLACAAGVWLRVGHGSHPPVQGERTTPPRPAPLVLDPETSDLPQPIESPVFTVDPLPEPPRILRRPAPAVPARVLPRPTPAVPPQVLSTPPAPLDFSARTALTEDELQRQLRAVPEVRLEGVAEVRAELTRYGEAATPKSLARPRRGQSSTFTPQTQAFPYRDRTEALAEKLLAQAEREGLPLRQGTENRLTLDAARYMDLLSTELRGVVGGSLPGTRLGAGRPRVLREMLDCARKHLSTVRTPRDMVPTVVQMLQVEDMEDRQSLVAELAMIRRPSAGEALARRAVFDLSPEVRRAAVEALQRRPREEYETILLDGLRYPWPPAADHAAEALTELGDVQAVPELVRQLALPDPAAPSFNERTRRYEVREVVCVNHLQNCCLCHAPSYRTEDPVRGLVAQPGRPLPPVSSVRYYKATSGAFVRADITYLKQDFSVLQPVARSRPWPEWQRFDYMVRTRVLAPDAVPRSPQTDVVYPQREAVTFALRRLTGKDGGTSATRWRELLWPTASPARPPLQGLGATDQK